MKQILIIFALSLALVLGLIACTGGDPANPGGGESSISAALTWGSGTATTGDPDLCWATWALEKEYTFEALITDNNECLPTIVDVEWCFDLAGDGTCTMGFLDYFTGSCDMSGAWWSNASQELTLTTIIPDELSIDYVDGIDCYPGSPATIAVRVLYTCEGDSDLLVAEASASATMIKASDSTTDSCD